MVDSTSKTPASPTVQPPESSRSPELRVSPTAVAGTSITRPPFEAAANEAPIEVDDSTTDDGSTIDDRISTYTASLTSSVVDYPTEYGRRYHSFRAGTYSFPNDETEMDRLDMVHTLLVKTIGGKLFLAPIEEAKTHRILDVGTGTGIWSIEMGDLFPNAEILGNDLSPIQPAWVPLNVKFEIDDVESEWVQDHKYDFIFSRYMAGSLADWPTYVRRVYENLNPGGWAEFQDWDYMLYSDDGSTEGTDMLRWMGFFMDACKVLGRDGQVGPKLESLVRENTGLTNVHHKPFKIPAGPWAKDPHLRDIGMCNLIQMLDGLEAFSLRLLCGALGWTKEEVLVLLAGVRNELKSGKAHAWLHYNVVYGQKPMNGEEE